MEDEILTRVEAMEFCKCKKGLFAELIADAKIPVRKVGKRKYLFLKSDLLAGIRRLQGDEMEQADASTAAAAILGEQE